MKNGIYPGSELKLPTFLDILSFLDLFGFLFCFILLTSCGMWDLTSPTMDRTHTPCIGTTREVPRPV